MNRLPPQLGHYRLLDKLGQGGMGVVYKAIDTHLDRPVALKILPPERLADSERKRRFVQEAKAASALNHPNIVTIHDISSDLGFDFMVMEWVDGKTLDELIPHHGMRLPELLRIALQIAEGLTTAHASGIIHRDIKPSNIMVSNAGHVKILDFGLAKLTERSEVTIEDKTVTARPLTGEGMIIGTVCYMSPEQAEGKKVDARTDIFSFGSVLYEMASGQRAFAGDTPASTLGAVIHKEPKPLIELIPMVPQDLDRLILRCLRKDRSRRLQAMADIHVALLDLKEDSDSGHLTGGVVPAPPSRRQWTVPVVISAALALSAAGSYIWSNRAKQPGALSESVLTQITRDSGITFQPALSPDGKLLAYASNRADGQNMDIWVQQMAGGQPVRLTRHPAADANPQFSPDGTTIYFVSRRAEGSIWAIPALGGDERVVSKEAFGSQILISPNGQQLAHKRFSYAGEASPFYLLSTAGGGSRRVELSIQAFTPEAWSPDSRSLIGWGSESVPNGSAREDYLYAVPATGGTAIPFKTNTGEKVRRAGSVRLVGDRLFLAAQGAINEYILSGESKLDEPVRQWAKFPGAGVHFTVSGRLIVAASMTGIEDIWSIAMDANRAKVTGAPVRLTNDEARDWCPSLSADGRKMIFTSDRHGSRDVWLRDVESGKETQVTATPESERRARISPDGEKVAYEVENKQIAIFVRDIAGSEPKLVCQDCALPRWTPDSRRVAYWDGSPVRFHTFDPVNGDRKKLLAHPTGSVQNAFLSPDGQWISFHLSEENGRTQVYIAAVRDGEAAEPSQWIPIFGSDRRYTHAWWSPDGSLLYVLDIGNSTIFAQLLDPVSKRPRGGPLPVFEPMPGMNYANPGLAGFSMVRDRLVFSMVQSKANLWRIE